MCANVVFFCPLAFCLSVSCPLLHLCLCLCLCVCICFVFCVDMLQTAIQARSPFIVQVFGVCDNPPAIIMERLDKSVWSKLREEETSGSPWFIVEILQCVRVVCCSCHVVVWELISAKH